MAKIEQRQESKVKIKLNRACAIPTGRKLKRQDGSEYDELKVTEPLHKVNNEMVQVEVDVPESYAKELCKPIKSYVDSFGQSDMKNKFIYRAEKV